MEDEENIQVKRRIQKNQLERQKRRSNIWFLRFKALVRLFFALFICLISYKLMFYKGWFLNEKTFSIPNRNPYIRIIGNKITPNYKILQALRSVKIPDAPIYMIQVEKMQKEVSKIDPIKKVYIRRLWFPARFNIFIEERKPILTISPSPKVLPIAFFAEGGKLIGREYLPLDKNAKTFLVLSYGTKGDDYHSWDEKKVLLIEKLAKTIQAYSGEQVEYIDMREPKDVYVKLQSTTLRLGEIDSTIEKRIRSISSIMPQIITLKKDIKYIDLRWEEAHYIKLEYNKNEISPDSAQQ